MRSLDVKLHRKWKYLRINMMDIYFPPAEKISEKKQIFLATALHWSFMTNNTGGFQASLWTIN